METTAKKKFSINGNTLKLFACIIMFIDHVGAVVIENGVLRLQHTDPALTLAAEQMQRWYNFDFILRMIGRLAFPIFCFLLVEGFLHTRDVKKYLTRLGVFALISEIPFNLAIADSFFSLSYQSVYVTLFLGLLTLEVMKRWEDSTWKRLLVVAAGALAAELLQTDYGAFGVIFITLLYLYRNDKVNQTILGCIACSWEITAPLAFIPIRLYNGKRGGMNLKYFFYWFYPVHLLALYLLRFFFVN